MPATKQKFRNKITLGGQLFDDPEYKQVGEKNTDLVIMALNYIFTTSSGKPFRTIYRIEMWGDDVEKARGLEKDDYIEVEGYIKTDTYTKSGESKSRKSTKICANELTRLDAEGIPISFDEAPIGAVESDPDDLPMDTEPF